jgi:hypothetical protein
VAGFAVQVRIRERRFRAVGPAVTVDVDDRCPGEIVDIVLQGLGDGRGTGSRI